MSALLERQIFVPEKFDPEKWTDQPPTPVPYNGTHFPFSVVQKFIKPAGDDEHIEILGETVEAVNLQIDEPEGDPGHPVYFGVPGGLFFYFFSFWADRAEIEAWEMDENKQPVKWVSTMFPTFARELERALITVVSDVRGTATVIPFPPPGA